MVYSSKLLGSMGRFWRTKIKRFGVFEVVGPVETTPSRNVPEHIEKPNYKKLIKLSEPEVKDEYKIYGMKRSCKLASNILLQVQKAVKPGITTDDIDEIVHNLTIDAGAYPSPLHYSGFPKSVCTSVNNVCVHGIPDLRPLQDGDIVNVDITVYFEGFHGDCSKTFLVGDVDDLGQQLVTVTEECLDIAIRTCGPKVPFNEIGHTIERHAKRNGLTVLPAFLGHGIGEYFHGPPDIYHMTNDYKGVMKAGMTFTIEPVLSHGSVDSVMLEDNWTVITEDNSRAAQAEHTILITENGAEILTKSLADNLKRRIYAGLDRAYAFAPLGVETLGPGGTEALQVFKKLFERLVELTCEPRAGEYLTQRISTAIQRGNAASILGTLPTSIYMDQLSYL